MKVTSIIVLIMSLGTWSWLANNESDLAPKAYVNYVQSIDNGLHKRKVIGDFVFDLQYKTKDYEVANRLRQEEITEEEYSNEIEKLGNGNYFLLKIAPKNATLPDITKYHVTNEQEYQARLYYLIFGMEADIRLETGNHSLKPQLFHFERSYDISQHKNFILVFDEKEEDKDLDKTLVIDSPYLGTGPIKIKIENKDIRNIPNLKVI